MAYKLIVVGFDGMDYDFCESEKLIPDYFKNEGFYGILKSTDPPLTAPAWTSIYTGLSPDEHSIKDFVWKYEKSKVFDQIPENKFVTFDDIKHETFWERINRRGYTIGIINMPLTYPVRAVGGYMVAGFPSPKMIHPNKRKTNGIYYPRELAYHLNGYIIDATDLEWNEENPEGLDLYEDKRNWDKMLKFIEEVYSKRLHFSLGISKIFPTDLLCICYTFLDRIGHWRNDWFIYGRDYLKEWYEKAFEIINVYKKVFNPDNILIISDHGFDTQYHNHDGVILGWGKDFENLGKIDAKVEDVFGLAVNCFQKNKCRIDEHHQIENKLRSLGYV